MTLKTENSSLISDEQFKKDNAQKSLRVQEESNFCPECGSELKLDSEKAEIICSCCGLVVEESLLDLGPEWRAFDHEQRDKRTRVGAPMTNTIHDKGLSTVMDWKN